MVFMVTIYLAVLMSQENIGNSTKNDISADETRDWLWFYLIIGWLIVLFQWLIVHNIEKRTRKVLASNGATDDDTPRRDATSMPSDVVARA